MGDDARRETSLDVFDEAPCGYIFTLPDGSFTRVNRTFLDWTGYTQEELLRGTRFQDLLTVPGKVFYENQYFPLLRMQGFVREVAFDIVTRDGERAPVLVNSVRKTGVDRAPAEIATAVFMVTDRRAYEQELLRARLEAEQLSAIVTMSADAIASCSAEGLIETWNAGARLMFGFSERDVEGMSLRELLPSIDDQEWMRILRDLQAGETAYLDAVGRRADGSTLDVSVGLAPHFGPVGDLAAVSTIMRDITEAKALQRLQNEFLAMTSHELRTPLTSIRGHAQLMLRRGAYDQSHMETIVAGTHQLGRLIEDLLLASRLEAERFDLRLAEVDVRAVVRDVVGQIAGAGARLIHVDAPAEPLPVRGDRTRLGQVFGNLLSNAMKYSPESADITIRVTGSASTVSVAVIDRGSGIPAEDIPHLFDRFYRVAATADYAQGAGLGLYIANRLVRAHGGSLTVESELSRGSVFTVSLPLLGDRNDEGDKHLPPSFGARSQQVPHL